MAAIDFPDSPPNGEKFTASNGVQYTYNTGNDTWTGALLNSNQPIEPTRSEVTAVPDFEGGNGTVSKPYIITPAVVLVAGGVATSAQTITFDAGQPGDIVNFTNDTVGTYADKYNQPSGIIGQDGTYSTVLYYNDSAGPTTTSDITYVGNLAVGPLVYFQWSVNQLASADLEVVTPPALTVETQPTDNPGQGGAPGGNNPNILSVTQPAVSGGSPPKTYEYFWEKSSSTSEPFTWTAISSTNQTTRAREVTAGLVGTWVRVRVKVTDSNPVITRSIETVSNIMNVLDVVATIPNEDLDPKLGDTISVSGVLTGNKAGYTISSYQWLANGNAISGANSASYFVSSADNVLGKTLKCRLKYITNNYPEILVVSNITNAVQEGAEVDTPQWLFPSNGAGQASDLNPDKMVTGMIVNISTISGSVGAGNLTQKLFFENTRDLDKMPLGAAFMCNNSGTQNSYRPRTGKILSVSSNARTLTFSSRADFIYCDIGDEVQVTSKNAVASSITPYYTKVSPEMGIGSGGYVWYQIFNYLTDYTPGFGFDPFISEAFSGSGNAAYASQGCDGNSFDPTPVCPILPAYYATSTLNVPCVDFNLGFGQSGSNGFSGLTINGVIPSYSSGLGPTVFGSDNIGGAFAGKLTEITYAMLRGPGGVGGSTYGLYFVALGGELLMNEDATKKVEIQSIDNSSLQIGVTKDGSWVGTDGSGKSGGYRYVEPDKTLSGTGIITEVDFENKSITIENSNGQWVMGGTYDSADESGNSKGTAFYLRGPDYTGQGPNPNTLRLTCSAFSGEYTTFLRSEWEISTTNNFSNTPSFSGQAAAFEMNVQDGSGSLDYDTNYFGRVRQVGDDTNGDEITSDWSGIGTAPATDGYTSFKTGPAPNAVYDFTNEPGTVVTFKDGQINTLSSPVQMVSLATAVNSQGPSVYACGADGDIYTNTGTDFKVLSFDDQGINPAICEFYNVSNKIASTKYIDIWISHNDSNYSCALQDDGNVIYSHNGTAYKFNDVHSGVDIEYIIKLGPDASCALLRGTNDKIYYVGPSGTIGTSGTLSGATFPEVAINGINGTCAKYVTSTFIDGTNHTNIIILGTDGKLAAARHVGSTAINSLTNIAGIGYETGTNIDPLPVAVDGTAVTDLFKMMSSMGSDDSDNYTGSSYGFSALTTDGDLWGYSGSVGVFGTLQPKFGLIDAVAPLSETRMTTQSSVKFLTPVLSNSGSGKGIAIDDANRINLFDQSEYAVQIGLGPFGNVSRFKTIGNIASGSTTTGDVIANTMLIFPGVNTKTLFYDANVGLPISSESLIDRYGTLQEANPSKGIYELTEQPDYPVSHYEYKADVNKYEPQEDEFLSARMLYDVIVKASQVWTSTTSYNNNQIVTYNGEIYQAKTSFTSGSTFDLNNWKMINQRLQHFVTDSGTVQVYTPPTSPDVDKKLIITVQAVDNGDGTTSNKYFVDGVQQDTVEITKHANYTYYFDQGDASNANHPLRFSTTPDGTHGGGVEYVTDKGEFPEDYNTNELGEYVFKENIYTAGTLGIYGSYHALKADLNTPTTLYYYCQHHPGMGGQINISGLVYPSV